MIPKEPPAGFAQPEGDFPRSSGVVFLARVIFASMTF